MMPTGTPMEPPAVQAIDIAKSFGPLQALRGVSMSLRRGKITAIVGDNGAGKSTFLKTLSGENQPDRGELRFDGRPVELRSTQDAQQQGVETVYQDLALAPDLSVAENIFLGREPMQSGLAGRLRMVDRRAMLDETRNVLGALGIQLKSYATPTRSLSGGQRQAIAVARAMKWAQHAVLMDEPTAALGARQREMVYEAIRAAARRNLAVLLVSHDLPQVLELADLIVVLRHGADVAHLDPKEVTLRDVIDAMLGEGAAHGRH
jgi:ABC-type sugar transport system ATPase subunit